MMVELAIRQHMFLPFILLMEQTEIGGSAVLVESIPKSQSRNTGSQLGKRP
jgi:hypothetical protein